MKWRCVFGLAVIFFCSAVYAKPVSEWQQIKHPLFTLIFQADIESEAKRVADKLGRYIGLHLSEMPLNQKLKPISIVLFSEEQTSNGNVGLMPYRSHWYNKPSPFSRLEWFDVLAVHESRHVVQINQINDTYAGKILAITFGDLGTAGLTGLFLPSWFLEGDAVVSETTLTDGGRGRVASFDLWFRTDTLENPVYSYERAMLGTGFDRVPYLSPYVLGYFLTSYLRSEYGSDLFDRVINHLATPTGFNFDGAIRAETTLSLSDQYQNMMVELKQRWLQQLAALELSTVTRLANQPQTHWNSIYPIAVYSRDGEPSQITAAVEIDVLDGDYLVEISDQNVRRLTHIPKSVSRNYYSGSKTRSLFKAGDRYCWVAAVEHPTKVLKQSGDLFCWSKLGVKRLTNRMNLTSASYQNGQFIAHQFNADRSSKLLLIAENGAVKGGAVNSQLELSNRSLAFDLAAADEGWFYVLSDGINDGLYFVDSSLTATSLILTAKNETLRSPIQTNNWLLYTSDQTGIDQLMVQSLTTGKQFQITTRPYGSYYPIWDEKNQRIIFADYSATGQQLSAIQFDDLDDSLKSWKAEENLPVTEPYASALISQKNLSVATGETDSYSAANYNVASHLWNPHSWSAYYDGAIFSAVINSSDILNKLWLDVGADYYIEKNTWLGNVTALYRTELGPYFSFTLQNNFLANSELSQSWQAQIIQPITIQQGLMTQSWLPGFGLGVQKQAGQITNEFLTARLEFFTEKDKSFQAIQTPFGFSQSIYGQYFPKSDSTSLLGATNLQLRGLNSKQTVSFQIKVQQLSALDGPLLEHNSLFDPPELDGITVQAGADYRINMGGVGLPLTPLTYWRNTNVLVNYRLQNAPDNIESAVGLTLKPSFNLLRNSNLVADPSVSVYYRSKYKDWQLKFSVVLAGF